MARKIRLEYEGAAYHVMARGNQGQPVFADDLDRTTWIKTLAEACEKTAWRVHAYVLMPKAVTRAVRAVKQGEDRRLERVRRRLLKGSQTGKGAD